MNEKEKIALVPRPPGTLEKAGTGTKRILSRMVGDTLTLATSKFRIGQYEWCEPDYIQLMAWAEQLRLNPDELLRRLKIRVSPEDAETTIENGRFVTLKWDVGLLPASEFRISQPLRLTQLSIFTQDSYYPRPSNLPSGYDLTARINQISTVALPELKQLDCAIIDLKILAAGRAASLESLECSDNHLEVLDLSPFPNLRTLNCFDNGCLTDLNLAHVPQLLELDCSSNLITGLGLRAVPNLRKLNCSDNDMRELILPNLPDLVELECENSSWDKGAGLGRYLEKIDLRGTPNLEHLNCSDNMLESLNLSCVPKLKHLECSWNPLTKLNLTDVPLLETLKCYNIPIEYWSNRNPPFIGSLDISGLRCLKELDCDNRTQIIQRPDQHFNAVKK